MSSNESTNLTQDSEMPNRDSYFSSPELSQRADLLRHLTENSNLIPLIRGVEGMGKSTFIQNLLDLAPENWIPVKIYADVMLQPDALLANLAALFDQDDRSERLIDELISYFEDLRHDGFLPVILVDDAHLLPEASIITLLRLHERSSDERPLAQILLFAEPEIDELLKTPQLRVMNLQSLQLLDMPEFTLEQTGLYLEHLLSSEDSSSIKPLSESQIEIIHSETGGSPGLIKEHAQSLIASAKKPDVAQTQRRSFSGGSMIGGGLLVAVVLLVLIFQDSINAIFSGDDETTDVTQKELIEEESYKPLAIPESAELATPEREIAEAGPVEQALQDNIEETEGEEADLGPVTEEDIQESAATEEVAEKPKEQKTQAETSQTKQVAEVQGVSKEVVQPAKEETTATETPALSKKKELTPPESVEKKVAATSAPSEKQPTKPADTEIPVNKGEPKANSVAPAVSPPKTDKQPQVAEKKPEPVKQKPKVETKPEKKSAPQLAKPVSKGAASEAEKQAKAVVASPPAQAKKKTELTPAPVEDRSTMLPKEETTTVKLADKPAKQTVEQSKAVVAKSIASAPENSSGQLLREQWLLKQKPSSYTIQLVGFQDEKGIAKFVQRHSLSGSVAYYRTQRNGKPWFPVLYGVYSTRSRAVAARGNLPKSLIDSGPWLRTMSAVQKDIRAR